MTRFALAALIAAFLAGSAFAVIPDAAVIALDVKTNETIIEKTQGWDMFNPLTVEECQTPTCEDVPS